TQLLTVCHEVPPVEFDGRFVRSWHGLSRRSGELARRFGRVSLVAELRRLVQWPVRAYHFESSGTHRLERKHEEADMAKSKSKPKSKSKSKPRAKAVTVAGLKRA